MTNQTYGQFCGVARALEVVGEPWALLVIRDLLVEPKSFAELRRGLPQVPAGVLSARLEELEGAGAIRRRAPSESKESSVFELTPYGAELEDIVMGLGRWGAQTMGGLRRDEFFSPDSLVIGLRGMFRSELARGLRMRFVIELGDSAVHAIVDDGQVECGKGHLLDADLIIEAGPALMFLLGGAMSPREALETDGIRLRAPDGSPGDPALLAWFVELFHVPPPPPARVAADGRVPSMRPEFGGPPPPPPAMAEHPLPVGAVG
jgi:DNA-binding HxlR family transcriptional regulator